MQEPVLHGVLSQEASKAEHPQNPPYFPLQFTKCHTDGNDFIIIDSSSLTSSQHLQPHVLARKTCDRSTGINGDGLLLVSMETIATNEVIVNLWNSDGSAAEISGNGTYCVAAFVMWKSLLITNSGFVACTRAGRRKVRFVKRIGNKFHFVIKMSIPIVERACEEI